ncbi:hypothetical protein ROHU_009270 [Labeo rohita]|uniref:Uncharacterized protein n=1 Tax=Labeo rohita TaxID=84645 RepID=A0A498M8S0_LABRO|nr:hypothetical protein ROHU_009270 [Labeo rohita]
MGLSLPVQQSHGSLRSQWGPSTRYAVARETLPPGAAEPQLPSEATRVPPSIDSNILAYPASDGESPSFDICHHAPPLATCRARQSDTSSRSSL